MRDDFTTKERTGAGTGEVLARLGYALATPENDVTLANLAELADLFYIGGTKCGAMFGEALVIANPAYQKDFRYMIKQRGALLA